MTYSLTVVDEHGENPHVIRVEGVEPLEITCQRIIDAKGGTMGAVARGLAEMGLGKSWRAFEVRTEQRRLADDSRVRIGIDFGGD